MSLSPPEVNCNFGWPKRRGLNRNFFFFFIVCPPPIILLLDLIIPSKLHRNCTQNPVEYEIRTLFLPELLWNPMEYEIRWKLHRNCTQNPVEYEIRTDFLSELLWKSSGIRNSKTFPPRTALDSQWKWPLQFSCSENVIIGRNNRFMEFGWGRLCFFSGNVAATVKKSFNNRWEFVV